MAMILKAMVGSILLAVAEVKLTEQHGSALPAPAPLVLPPLFGMVVLVNVVAASYVVTGLGSAVGKARERCGVSAGAFSTMLTSPSPRLGVPYPAMYAEGKSKAAVEFNCIQRGA